MSDFYEKLEKAKKKVNSGTVSKPAAPARPSGSSYDRFQSMMSKAKQTVSERSRAVAPAPRPVRSPIEMLRDQANINQMAFPGIDAKRAATDIVNGKMPMRKPTLKDLTIGSVKRGYIGSESGKAWNDEMHGRKNDKDELDARLNSEEFAFEPKGWQRLLAGPAEMVGQQINQMTNPESVAAGTGAALAASIAGKAGPQVAIPEEIVTVPAAFMKGMSVGSAKQNYEIEAGMAYKEMLDVGVTPETAKGIAMAVGAGNAALEAMQLDELVKSARIMKRSGADKVADGFFKNLMKEIGRRAPGVANEVAQEVAQEGVTIAGTQIGSKKDVGKFAYTSEDIAGRLGDTAISSLLTFGTMAAPGTAMSAYTNNQQQKRSAAIEQLRRSAEKMKADTEESSAVVAENATTTPTDREDRTVAKKETVQNESLRKGIQQVEEDGTVHNKAADAIASDKDAIQILREKAGLDLDSKTASSEKRRAIKDAVAALASSESEETVEESSYTTKEKTAPTQPYTREQYEADRAIVDEAQARVESAEASGAPQENIDALRSDLREKQGNVRAISDPGLKQYKSAYGENGQKAMTGMYQKGQNVGEYLGAFSRYYQAGVSGQKMNSVKGEYAFSITPAQRQAAYFAGKNDAKLSLQRETAARGQQKVSDGGIDFNDPYVRQRMSPGAAVQLDRVARALGLKVRFVDMVRPRMKDGKLQGTANAQIQGSEVLIEKGNPNSIRFLLGHEWTHRMQALSPKEYRAFRKVVSKEMAAEVQAKVDLYRSKGVELDYESALNEVAADYAGRLIEDGAFLDEFIHKNLEHRSMLEKVADAIHELVSKLTGKEKSQAAAAEAKLRKALKASMKQVEKNRKQDSIREKIERSEPVSGTDEVEYSLKLDSEYMDKAEKYNEGKKNPFVSAKNMVAAREARKAVADIFNDEKLRDSLGLPEDIIANTYIPNGSYSGTEENTTVCIRSMAADALMDAVAEYLGRPLTVEDTLAVSQEYWQYTDKGECRYCYVAMDRKAYREFLGSYLEQRDDAIQNLRNGMNPKEALIKFADGRVNKKGEISKNMRNRFNMWKRLNETGGEMITPADLASTAAMERAIERNPALKEQINDARKYAQSASWAKKRINYAAYNNHILRWKDDRIRKLNSNYGLRMYSFSDFSPAFILENMQMITDAAVRGLKVLAYTKEIDFVKIFAPTGMNINISVFGYGNKSMGVTQDGNGMVSMDAMQGADWAEAKAMREKYPNVGITFVATNDDQVEWALAQDWVDVVIPFHLVRTGSKVASYFGWKNYTSMSADLKNKDWKKGDAKSILPPEHQNDKAKYLEACRRNHLTPRFVEWIDNPNYMKLVNETRRSEGETPTVQPIFDVDAAKASIETMRKQGGYYKPIGGDEENMRDIAADIGDKINEGKTQYSLKEDDAEYMAAVESGNMEAAQKMVDEAAESKGYNIHLYHGTAAEPFYVFRQGSEGIHFGTLEQATDRARVSERDEQAKVERYKVSYIAENISDFPDGARREILEYIAYVSGADISDEDMEKISDIINDDDSHVNDSFILKFLNLPEVQKKRISINNAVMEKEIHGRIISAYVKAESPLVIDADIAGWTPWNLSNILADVINGEDSAPHVTGLNLGASDVGSLKELSESSDFGDIASFLESKGMDSIKYRNAYEGNKKDYSYILFSPNQIKSADPVVYDDSGKVIPLSERFNQDEKDIRYSLKGTSEDSQMADLKKENAALQRRLEYWMEQSKVNKFPKPDKAALKKAAASLLKTYTSKADADSIIAKMAELYDGIIRDPEGEKKETYEQAWELADTIAQEIVDSALETDDEMYNDYAELRKIIRDKKIVLPESAKADIPDWSEWKGTVGKRLHVVVGKEGNIDSFYKDLAKEYPNFFDEERESAASDQLLRIAEIVNELYNINEYNPFEKDDTTYKRAVMDAANEVMETVFDLPKAKPTRAEKAAKQADDQLLAEQMYQGRKLAKVQRDKMSADQRIAALRQKVKDERKTAEWMAAETKLAEEVYYGAKIAELRRKNRERSAELLNREKDRRTEQVERLKDRYREKDAQKRESRNAKELRAKIIRHVGKMSTKLLRPTDNQHIPDSLRTATLELMQAINLESGYETITLEDGTTKRVPAGTDPKAEATKRTEKFRELNAIYTKLLEDQPDMAAVMDPDLMANLAELTSAESGLAGKPIANMSLEQLTTVWKTIRAVEASIAGANKAFAAGRYATVAEWADALERANRLRNDRGEYNSRTLGKIVDLATIKMMTPQQFLHQMGMDDLFQMLRRAQDKKIRILDEAQKEVHKIIGKTKIRKLEKEVNIFRVGSGDIELSTAQIMSLYELMKREPAKQHILEGGIWPDLIPGQKGIKSHRSNERIQVTEFDLNTMFDSLTDEEKRIADNLQQLLAGRMAAYGNEASNAIYNYSKFGEENYFPMKVDKRTVASKPQDVSGGVKTIAGTGSAKTLKPNAQNGLIIGSIFDVVSDNINEMSTYAAWLPAITDLTRIINFVYRDSETGEINGYAKDIFTRVMGQGGLNYIRKLADDINAGVSGEPAITNGMIGKFKAAAIGGNIRVFLQQPSAIFRAFSMISPKYMAMAKPKRGTWEKVKKYVPIAVWKDWGYFDVRTGRGIKDIVFDVSGQTRYRDIFRNPKDVVEKINQAAMQPAGTMDSLAWSYLWSICEAEVADTHKAMDRNSEAFNQLVAQRFTDIIDQTQVVDGIMQRSDAMRSENALDKMATAFMAEPTKTYNMLLGAISDLRNGDDKKAARHALGRTMGAVVVSFAVNAIAQSAVDALRDDDDDDYDKKFWDAYLENFSENFNPFSYVPYMKDIVSMLQGYDVKRTDMEVFSRIIASGRNLTKALSGESKQSVPGAFANFLLESSRMFGMPLANIKRDVQAALRTIFRANGNYLAQYYGGKLIYSVTQNTSMFSGILYDAYKHDKTAYKAIYEDMRKSGVSDKKIQNAIERGMKADQGVTKAEDLKSRYMTPEQQAVYDTYSRKVRSSSAWREADADERKSAERKLFQMATRDPENDNRKKKLTHNQEALEILRQLAN